ncbi:MAG: helix-turn-helix domain-containing protein, partial [Porticoccus sp.]
QNRSTEYFNQFTLLINQDFSAHRKVESYARELGITAPYLNNLCQQLVQKNALHLIHERLLLEAKRNLIYTVLSISEIAYQLGFSDPAYFTRFFKRLTNQSPKEFRKLIE